MSTSVELSRNDREACVCYIAKLFCSGARCTRLAGDDKGSRQLPAFENGCAIGCGDGCEVIVCQGRRSTTQEMEEQREKKEMHRLRKD